MSYGNYSRIRKRVAQKPLCWAVGSSQPAHGESQECRALPKNGGTNRTTPRSENKATPRPTSLRCFFQTLPGKTLMRTQPLFCNKTPPKVVGMFPSIALQAILPDSLSPARGHERQFFSASFVTDVDPEDETRVHCQSECGGKKGTREERQECEVRDVCYIFLNRKLFYMKTFCLSYPFLDTFLSLYGYLSTKMKMC